MSQLIPIVSEALQATVRRLLPSQAGFGEDLQASNVIVPIIDLTPSAEGSDLATDLQRALSFDGVTAWSVANNTDVIANSPGFYRIFGCVDVRGVASTNNLVQFELSDGLSTKIIWQSKNANGASDEISSNTVDFVVFLAAGESISVTSNSDSSKASGSSRQIADVNGLISNPAGYAAQ